jgi:hypothetical protein
MDANSGGHEDLEGDLRFSGQIESLPLNDRPAISGRVAAQIRQ